MNGPRFQFGNVVVVDDDQIGVILKTWEAPGSFDYEVYVRSCNTIKEYNERDIKHYVYSKYLYEDEYKFYAPN